jgi:hypothetical protein
MSTPAPGDILIANDSDDQASYALSVVPGPPQLRCRTYEQAMTVARAWAAQRGVAIWKKDDGRTLDIVGTKQDDAPSV